MSHRIVVVGHGMVGHRFLADLASHRLDDVEVTVLGEEGHAAYNRILLARRDHGPRRPARAHAAREPGYGCRCAAARPRD